MQLNGSLSTTRVVIRLSLPPPELKTDAPPDQSAPGSSHSHKPSPHRATAPTAAASGKCPCTASGTGFANTASRSATRPWPHPVKHRAQSSPPSPPAHNHPSARHTDRRPAPDTPPLAAASQSPRPSVGRKSATFSSARACAQIPCAIEVTRANSCARSDGTLVIRS